MKFPVLGAISAVAGAVVAVAVVFTGTNLAQEDTRPVVEATPAEDSIAGQPEYGRR